MSRDGGPLPLAPQETGDSASSGESVDHGILPGGNPSSSSLQRMSSNHEQSYFNHCSTSSDSSIVSLSKFSLAGQLSQLRSLQLPNPKSFSTSISSIPTAPKAAKASGNAADQMRTWLQKANDILTTMDAEDDVEWAAAAGREGLEEIEKAVGRFEGLIRLYVEAIENLQERPDISDVPSKELEALVEQMEIVLGNWNKVRAHLKTVRSQVEIAMEWKELWNVVLHDITKEVESLNLLIFEMEEKRHMPPSPEEVSDNVGLDVQELETIIEEAPTNAQLKANQRFSLPAAFSADSPLTSPGFARAQDDSNLMALFARMQPLRASLDFLPMTLSSFRTRADQSMPSACEELEDRRKSLEKKWKALEKDAETLRKELSEDRWVLVFRNAGRQAEKLCESVERSISKLRESIDAGAHHVNPATLAKKVESYEAKKMHYGPAVERVLAIIERGVTDRQTVNIEVLRLRTRSKQRWTSLQSQMETLDAAIEEINTKKNQQLRDSVSSIVSMDRSAPGSTVDTPGSSPASSVVGTPNGKGDGSSPAVNGASRRSSIASHPTSRSSSTRRVFTAPSQMPRKAPGHRSLTSDSWSTSRAASPSPQQRKFSSTPTPDGRRPSLVSDGKPRWNSSPKVDYNDYRPPSRLQNHMTPPTGRKSSLSFRSPSSAGSAHISALPLPSPLGRSESTPSPISRPFPSSLSHRPRMPSGAQSSLGHREPSAPTTPITNPSPRLYRQSSANYVPSSRRESLVVGTSYPPLPSSAESASIVEEPAVLGSSEQPSPSNRAATKATRPATAMASSRRASMLPQPSRHRRS